MAQGYAGIPPGPLSAYLGVREANRQAGLEELQGAGVLQKLAMQAEAQQRANEYRARIAGAQTDKEREEIALSFGGPEGAIKHLDRQAQIAATREATIGRLQQAEQALELRNQWETQRIQGIQDENRRKAEDSAWRKTYETGLLGLKNEQLKLERENNALKLQRQLDQQVQGLGTALERANLPEADAVLRGVEDALNAVPSLAEYISGPKSIIPDLAVPRNVAIGRQAFQKLFNITLKNRSGAAVTNPEFERLKSEFASGAWKTPQQLKAGVEQARKIVSEHYKSVAAGFGPAAMEAYNANLRQFGGTPLLEPDTASAAPAPTVPAVATQSKRIRFDAQGNQLP